jgi:hypothetical protein
MTDMPVTDMPVTDMPVTDMQMTNMLFTVMSVMASGYGMGLGIGLWHGVGRRETHLGSFLGKFGKSLTRRTNCATLVLSFSDVTGQEIAMALGDSQR